MNLRSVETALARFTLGFVAVYFPIETYASWDRGLLSPFYLVDLIAMVLLACGAFRSLGARPGRDASLLCAAYGWTAANAWRAASGRIYEVRRGGQLDFGAVELCTVISSTVLILACFALSLFLVLRRNSGPASQ